MKRALFALIWCVVFYFLGCFLVGGIAGGIAGAKDPDHAATVGAQAGERAVSSGVVYIFASAAGLAVLGSITGILPGTKRKPRAAMAKVTRAWAEGRKIRVELQDGREIAFPVDRIQRLRNATENQLATVKIEARGHVLRWEELDEDLSIDGILAGRWLP